MSATTIEALALALAALALRVGARLLPARARRALDAASHRMALRRLQRRRAALRPAVHPH